MAGNQPPLVKAIKNDALGLKGVIVDRDRASSQQDESLPAPSPRRVSPLNRSVWSPGQRPDFGELLL